MRIFITGISGVFGSAMVAALGRHDDIEVSGADRVLTGGVGERLDIRDSAALTRAMTGCDVVIHAAAALPSYSAAEIQSIDVDGTRSVLSAAASAGVGRIVHVSSTAVYGLPTMVPTPETYGFHGVDPYSRAKGDAERECEQARHRFDGIAILRPKTFLGPGRLGLFAMLFEWAHQGRNFPVLGSGQQRTQMLDVDDLCDVTRAVLARDAGEVNEAYNIGATRFGTIEADFQTVLDAAGHGKRVKHLPLAPATALLRLASRFGGSPVYPRLISKLRDHSYVDTTRAETELGFSPKYSNAESLLRTFEWWQRSPTESTGTTHTSAWKQGVLAVAKPLFA